TYSPLRTWNVGPGSRVAVIGLGGLGHMAIKLAKALGAEVTLFSRSPNKEADARRLGAYVTAVFGESLPWVAVLAIAAGVGLVTALLVGLS
ncbi:MAG: zinc-binding dehydrogenase, partial [Comamonas sp.]